MRRSAHLHYSRRCYCCCCRCARSSCAGRCLSEPSARWWRNACSWPSSSVRQYWWRNAGMRRCSAPTRSPHLGRLSLAHCSARVLAHCGCCCFQRSASGAMCRPRIMHLRVGGSISIVFERSSRVRHISNFYQTAAALFHNAPSNIYTGPGAAAYYAKGHVPRRRWPCEYTCALRLSLSSLVCRLFSCRSLFFSHYVEKFNSVTHSPRRRGWRVCQASAAVVNHARRLIFSTALPLVELMYWKDIRARCVDTCCGCFLYAGKQIIFLVACV